MTAPSREQAALALTLAALRLLTHCEHDEPEPGSCQDCEPLPPLVRLALVGVPRLCPAAAAAVDDSAALREALELVEAAARADGRGDLARLAAEQARLEREQSA